MKGFFGNLFGNQPKPQIQGAPVKPPPPPNKPAGHYKKGDVIGGTYEVRGILGKGGFGVVYLVYCRDTAHVCALKTFRDELLADPTARAAFKSEALLWVNLDKHPCIVVATAVAEVSGRLFVGMDYVAPDVHGRVNLGDHLAGARRPMDTNQALSWGIQFCLGMEHAKTHGLACHRDIKPANILITHDGTLKISDFGLATAAEAAWRASSGRDGSLVAISEKSGFGLSLMQTEGKVRCGTPGYIAPEVYRGEAEGIRSDIYSFGLVLWQMASGSPVPPFLVPYRGDIEGFMRVVYEQQMASRVPRVDGPLFPVTERCLRPSPAERYGSFEELRRALAPILEKRGIRVEVLEAGEGAAFWNNKGASLLSLGRCDEAIRCCDKALSIDQSQAGTWANKGIRLDQLGQHAEAIGCYDKALAIDPRNASHLLNKGSALNALGRHEQAIDCYDRALAIDSRDAQVWNNKGCVLDDLGRSADAIACYDKALAIDPRYTKAWSNKGNTLRTLGRCTEAVACYDKALAIDPLCARDWYYKGNAVEALGRSAEALVCYDRALAIDPRYTEAWSNKGNALFTLGQLPEAIVCYDKALAINPLYGQVWYNKGLTLRMLGRSAEALACYDEAVVIDPQDARAWNGRGYLLEGVDRSADAIACYDKALTANPRYTDAWSNKGYALAGLGRCEEALSCFDKALAIDPQTAKALLGKAQSEDALRLWREAKSSYQKFIELRPAPETEAVAHAQRRLQELETLGA